ETTYIVQAGDNLFRIGLKFGISWVQIAEANGLVNPNLIAAGDELKIPVDTPGPAPAFSHVVKPGETLFLISLQYGVAWPTIAEANNITSPYVIYVGQTLEIPGN
ncbi:MAG: LysM domain-containing protein, partial [Candidatus Promineifilaceae bacterium]